MLHTCVKPACTNTYESEEVDAYYCPDCAKANKALAAQIDAQIAARPKRDRVSAWQQYEEQANVKGPGGMTGMIVKF